MRIEYDRPTVGPRAHARHRERGPKVHLRITYPVLAALVGLSAKTLRNLATGKGRRFDPTSLDSVLTFVQDRRARNK